MLDLLQAPAATYTPISPARLSRQSNDLNDDWYTRYVDYAAGHQTNKTEQDKPIEDEFKTRAQASSEVFPNEWRQWILDAKLQGRLDNEIADTLVAFGFSCDRQTMRLGERLLTHMRPRRFRRYDAIERRRPF